MVISNTCVARFSNVSGSDRSMLANVSAAQLRPPKRAARGGKSR